jgi:opacity protein-like surface antigen
MKRILCCLAMMVVAFSVPALAAGNLDEGNGEIGVGVGSTNLDSNTGFDSATSLAVRGGYCFNKNFEIEGQLSSASESQDIAGTNVDGTFRQYMVNGVYNFETPKAIVPYVMAGLGLADTEVEVSGVSVSDSGTAYQIGGGSRFFFGKAKKAAFRIDLAMVTENTFNESSTSTNISAGFTWKLGNR